MGGDVSWDSVFVQGSLEVSLINIGTIMGDSG